MVRPRNLTSGSGKVEPQVHYSELEAQLTTAQERIADLIATKDKATARVVQLEAEKRRIVEAGDALADEAESRDRQAGKPHPTELEKRAATYRKAVEGSG